MTLGKVGCFVALCLAGKPAHAGGGSPPGDAGHIPAIILKVEGEGVANVRKHTGVVESAGARGKVYPGDKVITDPRSTVHLMLSDGTIVKVGFNTEFALAEVENRGHFLSWLFKLGRGSIRALVEKVPGGDTHLRVETTASTVGVRGTEFVLAHDEGSGTSFLYLIDGLVSFGGHDCEKTKSCLDVRAGETSSVQKGKPAPVKPQRFEVKELFGVAGPNPAPETVTARLSLFRDARKAGQARPGALSEAELSKITTEAVLELAEAQDRAIGRTKAEREAIHAAIKNGTYEYVMAAADAYAEAKGIFRADANGGAENLVAQTVAAKFRLGMSVIAADKAGVFTDNEAGGAGQSAKPELTGHAKEVADAIAREKEARDEWAERTFRERKSVGYEQSADAKAKRESLHDASSDYRDTLEYVEAVDEKQVKKSQEAEAAESAESARRHAGAGEHCVPVCVAKRVDHEAETAAEGSVAAFSGKTQEALSKAVASRKGRGGLPGHVKTKYFSRTVAGNSCTTTRQTCKMVPCSALTRGARGTKCKASDLIRECENKLVPVRCPD